MSVPVDWPDVPIERRLCEACLETDATAGDLLCDDCAADHEANHGSAQ